MDQGWPFCCISVSHASLPHFGSLSFTLHISHSSHLHPTKSRGHDFRPAFRKLTWVREEFPDVPVMACTGTATAKVIQDIRDILQLGKSVPCIMGTFNRENISYEGKGSAGWLIDILITSTDNCLVVKLQSMNQFFNSSIQRFTQCYQVTRGHHGPHSCCEEAARYRY